MADNMTEILKPLPEKLCNVYDEKLKSVILYGSYARGTADAESDVNVAVIIDGTDEEMEVFAKQLIDVIGDFTLGNQCRWLFSMIPIQFSLYERWKETLPFYRNIVKEGIPPYTS